MRVLIVTNMYPSAEHPFYGSFVKNQAEELYELGQEVAVVGNSNPKRGLPTALVKYFSLFGRTLFRGLLWRPDIIHVHYIFPTMIPAILLKWILRVPLIVTSHRGDVFDMPYKNKLIFKLTRYCIGQATTVVAVSKEIETQIRENLRCPNVDIEIIDMGHKLKKTQTKPRQTSGNRILFIGLSFERKGGFDLLQAIERIVKIDNLDFKVSFIGEFPSEASEYLSENNLNSAVNVLGKIPHGEVSKILEENDIFVLPSYSEGLPVSMLEAMSMGLAIISSDVGGIPETLKHGSGILVKPGDVEGLVTALRKVLTDHEFRNSIAQTALTRAKEYTSERKTEALIDVYTLARSKKKCAATKSEAR